MPSIIFYDPNGRHHPLHNDPDILSLQCLECLYGNVLTNDHVLPVVCICYQDPSTIINEVQGVRPSVLFYLCTECSTCKTPVNVNDNIRKNIEFSSSSGWKFQILLDRTKKNQVRDFREQAMEDLEKLKKIKQESSSESQVSVKVKSQNPNLNPSPNISDGDSQGEETEETRHQIVTFLILIFFIKMTFI